MIFIPKVCGTCAGATRALNFVYSLKNNKNTARELSSIINYILQKGKKIVTLEKLLEE